MKNRRIWAAVTSLIVMLLVACVRSENFFESVERTVHETTGWDEAARREDPVGYLDFVESQLRDDLGKMHETRRSLATELSSISEKEQELTAKQEYAEQMAEQFRSAWRVGQFPLEVRNAAYTKDQAESQVSVLLAQIDGYTDSLSRVRTARQQSEERVEQLTVQVVRTETNLALIATQRELLKAEELTTTSDQLVAQVDALFTDNRAAIHGSPVRSVEELMASGDVTTVARQTSRDRVSAYLSASEKPPEVTSSGRVAAE